jgi:Trehalose utilisation
MARAREDGAITAPRRLRLAIAALLTALTLVAPESTAAREPKRVIILVGGNTPHNPGVHEAGNGVRRIAALLEVAPAIAGRFAIRAYPDGWPADGIAFDGAATILWYFDGLEHHPLRDPARRGQFAKLMKRGVGLITLHQASTLLRDDRQIDLGSWLGGVRHGMIDRTVETVALTPTRHPVARGVMPFAYRDEFYPTLRYAPRGVTPVLTGMLHLEAAPQLPPTRRTVAWAFDRPGGGRSVGMTGIHYLAALDQPEVRQLLANAVAWTAGEVIPRNGVALANGEKAR